LNGSEFTGIGNTVAADVRPNVQVERRAALTTAK